MMGSPINNNDLLTNLNWNQDLLNLHSNHPFHSSIHSSSISPTCLKQFILDYLAVECYEKTLLKLVQSHPFIQDLLDHGLKIESTSMIDSSCSSSSSSPFASQTNSSSHVFNNNKDGMVLNNVKPSSSTFHSEPFFSINEPHSGFPLYLTPSLAYAIKTLRLRKHLTLLILTGQVTQAKQLCQTSFPTLFPSSSLLTTEKNFTMSVEFQLDTQIFIELVRSNQPHLALQFAHQSMLSHPFTSSTPFMVNTLTELISLIAYPSPLLSPWAHFLDVNKRKSLAQWMNVQILSTFVSSNSSSSSTSLNPSYFSPYSEPLTTPSFNKKETHIQMKEMDVEMEVETQTPKLNNPTFQPFETHPLLQTTTCMASSQLELLLKQWYLVNEHLRQLLRT